MILVLLLRSSTASPPVPAERTAWIWALGKFAHGAMLRRLLADDRSRVVLSRFIATSRVPLA